MHKWSYRYAGLQITSDLELPEWEAFLETEAFDHPDILFRIDNAQKDECHATILNPIVTATDFRFFMPDVGGYRVTNGSEIVVSPVQHAGPSELRLFLLGSAWGALCYQRDLFALHASAVQVGNEAVLFCAFQGKGKSTITAWLASRGHALVSDDLCCITMFPNVQPSVFPSAQRFRLWNDALNALGWSRSDLERDHFRFDKYITPWNGEPIKSPLPLKAIYLLEWGEPNLVRLSGANALHRFVSAATYRGELLHQMGLSGSYWQRCLELVQKVPVWELTRPKDLTIINDAAEMLEQHWTSNSSS